MRKEIDILIVGLGAHGSAILHETAKQAKDLGEQVSILGIDQFEIPHKFGSSHGDTRLFRMSHPQGEPYISMARRGRELLTSLESQGQVKLHHITGGLTISSNIPKNLPSILSSQAVSAKIEHRNLTNDDLAESHKQIKIDEMDIGYYENDTAVFFPELILSARLKEAQKLGAAINFNEKLMSYEYDEERNVTHVITSSGQYEVKKLFLATGPWLPEQAQLLENEVDRYYATVHWLDVDDTAKESYQLGNFPITLSLKEGGRSLILFPTLPKIDQVKVFYFGDPTPLDPSISLSNLHDTIKPESPEKFFEINIEGNFQHLKPSKVPPEVCPYTKTKSNSFIIQPLPNCNGSIIVVSACLRQGFKYSFAIGEALANYALTNTFDNSFNIFQSFPFPKGIALKPSKIMKGLGSLLTASGTFSRADTEHQSSSKISQDPQTATARK